MKKLFKKSIALVLSAALCLTALIGCLTVSADGTATTETTKPAFILGTASGKAGETVNLDGSITVISGISAHDVSFTFPAGFEVLSVSGDPGLVNGDELNGTESDTSASASETSENSNYKQFEASTATVAKDYTKTTTADGKTVIRFVDVHQLDAAATYGIRFSVKIPSDATVGDQTVTIDAKVAKDKTTEDTETLLPADDITVTAGKITVEPTYIDYTSAQFDVETGVLTVNRAAFNATMQAALSEAISKNNPKPYLVVQIGESEYTFAGDALFGFGIGSMTVGGISLQLMNKQIKLFLRITADDNYKFETNAYSTTITELLSAAGGDSKSVALLALINNSENSTEKIDVSYSGEGTYLDYTSAEYDVKTGVLTVNRAAFNTTMQAALSEAISKNNPKPYLVVQIGESEYTFAGDALFGSGSGSMTVGGISLQLMNKQIKLSLRITADDNYKFETNAVSLNLHETFMAKENSAFAGYYQALFE